MASLDTLPQDLLHHIFSFLDLQSLARTDRVARLFYSLNFNKLRAKQLLYKSEHWVFAMRHLKGKDIIEKAPFYALNEEYHKCHPLYQTMQELEALLSVEPSEREKAAILYRKASEGPLEDKVHYAEVIITSDKFHSLILEYECHDWMDFLKENINSESSKIVLHLLASIPFQDYISKQRIDTPLLRILRLCREGAIAFFSNAGLEGWRRQIFTSAWSLFWLEKLLVEVATENPDIIPIILESKALQDWILSDKYAAATIEKLLKPSKEGLMMLQDNSGLSRLKAKFLSCVFSESGSSGAVHCRDRFAEYPKADQFLIQHPEILRPLSLSFSGYQITTLIELYPDTFNLFEYNATHYLTIMPDKANSENQFNLLKKDTVPSNWLNAQGLSAYPDFVYHSFLSHHQAQFLKFLIQVERRDKDVLIQPVFIRRAQCNMEYLKSPFHGNLVTQGKLTLHQLLKMTPGQFLSQCPLEKWGEGISHEHSTKIKILHAVYDALLKDARDFLKYQRVNSLVDFIEKIFTDKESVFDQLLKFNFENLFSLSLQNMIQTNHIGFEAACSLEDSLVVRAKSIDEMCNKKFNAQHQGTNKAQLIPKALGLIDRNQKLGARFDQLYRAVNCAPTAFFKSQTTKHNSLKPHNQATPFQIVNAMSRHSIS